MTASVEEFAAEAASWLAQNCESRSDEPLETELVWGDGEFSVAVFHALSFDEERDLLESAKEWQQRKASRGYHAITGDPAWGGLGLSKEHARAFAAVERGFEPPPRHESFSVTVGLIAPTVELFGTDEQKEQFVAQFLAAEMLCCQLFSEPGAGTDLGALGCRAVRDGDEWVINGQKVWSSGAQFCEWGELIARSDPDAVKHKGMTAFMVPMDAEGVEIRPIKQMSGGTSFNEVFFNDCRVHDSLRLGPEGEGWKVALTTLGFERDKSDSGGSSSGRVGGSWRQLLATAEALGVTDDAVMRQDLMDVYIHGRVEAMLNRRASDLAREGTPGPEGSLGKLMWTEGMTKMADVASRILQSRLVVDTGEWGTWEWGEHVLGAPGYRIAGGSDEVQRNIIGERVLGLPGEPRVDKGIPWKDVPR
ncbi:MAG: acyl-CoA dehydrogenase family protein [Acidimicrobiales bacterium]|nr:acyl-CoA dehydrogenase family protein [Acidimicrobiales bacterium]